MSMYFKSQCYPVESDFQTSEKELPSRQNFLQGKLKTRFNIGATTVVRATAITSQYLSYKDQKRAIK